MTFSLLSPSSAVTVHTERNLRKRSMYLRINLAFAGMFLEGCAFTECWFMGSNCKFWTINSLNLPSVIVINVWFHFISLASVKNLAAISLERMHAKFRPVKHRLIKKKIFRAAVSILTITSGLCSAIGVLVVFHTMSRPFYLILVIFSCFALKLSLCLKSFLAIQIVSGNQPHQLPVKKEN